eukprot:m.69618 g.69618  ORF g.69618 m.69618 type:complete len:107 (-) comp12069_c0_seq4:1115-1435(-)
MPRYRLLDVYNRAQATTTRNLRTYEDTQGDQWKFTGAHKLLSVFINSLSNLVMFFSLISPRRPWAVSVFRAPVSGTMILSRLNANLSDPNCDFICSVSWFLASWSA